MSTELNVKLSQHWDRGAWYFNVRVTENHLAPDGHVVTEIHHSGMSIKKSETAKNVVRNFIVSALDTELNAVIMGGSDE